MSFLETSYKGTKRKNKDAVFEIIDSECCPLDCLKRLPFNDIDSVRSEFTSLETIADERNYILNYLKDNTSITYKADKDAKNTTVFRIKGTHVCKQAWIKVNGIKLRRFEIIYCDFKDGSEVYVHGNTGSKRSTTKTSECIAWLKFLVNSIGDQQPDSGKVHLPSCFSKLALYQKMISELGSDGTVSRSHFYGIMEKEFEHVSIPKVTLTSQQQQRG